MSHIRKRLEAISEIFESEKSYVYEMRLWSTEFRKILLNTQHIPMKRRVLLNNYIFLNIEEIVQLHESILNEMKEKNKKCRIAANVPLCENDSMRIDLNNELDVYVNLDYTEILEKYLHKFDIYRYYLEMFPKTEFILKREIALNQKFGEEVKSFLEQTGYTFMGYKHFMTRPSQKLNRYPLLLNGVCKRTEDENIKKRIKIINDFLMRKTKEYDVLFGRVKNAFWLYEIHYSLSFKERIKNKYPLGFFMKERKLVQISTDIFVRSKHYDEPVPFKIYLTDNMLIVIDVVVLPFGEQLFVVDEPVPLIKYLLLDKFPDDLKIDYFKEKHRFMLKEIDGDNNLCLYFKTEAQCKELRTAILNGMQLLKNKFNPEIRLNEFGPIDESVDDIILADPYFIGRSFSNEELIRFNQIMLEGVRKDNNSIYRVNRYKKEHGQTIAEIDGPVYPHKLKDRNINKQDADIPENKTKELQETKKTEIEDVFDPCDLKKKINTNDGLEEICVNQASIELDSFKHKSSTENDLDSIQKKHDFLEKTTNCVDITKNDNSVDLNSYIYPSEIENTFSNMRISEIEELSEDFNSVIEDCHANIQAFIGKFDKGHKFDLERLKKSREIFTETFSSDGSENEAIFFVKADGVYMKSKNETRCIYPNYVKRFIYISQFNIICFIDGDACYWSRIPYDELETNLICYKADNIWFGNTTNSFFLVVKLVSKTNSSFLHLFEIQDKKFTLVTQLYIGADIEQLIFLTSMLIVCCVDFEIINMYTLDTHELLNTNDMFIELLYSNQHPTVAMDVFKADKEKFLVCNDKIGFYIDQQGSCWKDTPYFVWYNKPKEFKMFSNYVIVIFKEGLVVYNAENGDVVKWIVKPGLKFVMCCSSVWVHNGTTLYELMLPLSKI